jgi:hypothetical protein
MSRRRRAGTALLLTMVGAVAAAPASAAESVTVVADRLDNPRGIAFGPGGALWIAEAGRAGPRCMGEGQEASCVGGSSAVTRVWRGRVSRRVTGLPSFGGQDGSFTGGVTDVSVAADGRLFAIVNGIGPRLPQGMPARLRATVGRVLEVRGFQSRRVVGNVQPFEYRFNPDRTDRLSNPYAVLGFADRQIVVDAGANAVFEVRNGRTSLLAVLPMNGRAQSVPTSITLGPDGANYVGEFVGEGPGGPRVNAARVFRIAHGERPTVYATGFNAISDLAFGPDGSLYVSEWTSNPRSQNPSGDVVRVTPGGTRTRLGVGSLFFPAGVAVGADGDVYVANWSILPARTPARGPFRGARGQVVRLNVTP